MKAFPRILGLSVVLSAGAWAQPNSAEELLRHVAASYSNAPSYYFEATETTRTQSANLGRVQERVISTAKDSSQRWRVEVEDSSLHAITVFDGRETTTYQPASGQYLVEAGPPAVRASLGAANLRNYFKSRYSTLAERLQTARMLSEEIRQLDGRGILCKVIEAEYAAPPGSAVASLRRTFWVDPAESRILREESEARLTSPRGEGVVLEQTIWFHAAALGDGVQADLFAFSPPPGSRKVESFDQEFAAGGAMIGNPAPAFRLPSIDGKSYSLEDLRGKVVLLNFWATWCVPCRLEMPLLEEIHRDGAKQGLVVLGINNEDPELVLRFLEEQGHTFPTLADGDSTVARAYSVEAIPTTVGIDRAGNVAFRHAGAQSKNDLVEALATAGFKTLR